MTTIDGTTDATIPHDAVARNTFLILGFQFIAKLLGFVGSVYLANYFGAVLFGAYNYAFALTALFIPVCDLGLDMFLLRDIPRNTIAKSSADFAVVLIGKAFLATVVIILVTIAAAALESWGSANFRYVLLAGGITVLKTFWASYSSVLRGLNRVVSEAGLYIAARAGEFAAILYCVLTHQSLEHLLILLVLIDGSALVGTHVVVSRKYLKPSFAVDLPALKDAFRQGLPFALTTILVAVYFNLDTVLVSKLVNEESAGLYRAVYNLILPTMMVTAAASGAIFPYVSQNYIRNRQNVEQIVVRGSRYLLLFSLPVAVFCSMKSASIVQLLFSPEYAPSAVSLSILVWFIPIVYLTNLFGNSLGAMDQQPFVFKVAAVNVVFNIVANLLLIPRYAQNGASVVTVLTEMIGLFLLSRKMRQYVHNIVTARFLLRVVAALVPPTVILYLFPGMKTVLALGTAGLLYLAFSFVLRTVTVGEIRELVHTLRGTHAHP